MWSSLQRMALVWLVILWKSYTIHISLIHKTWGYAKKWNFHIFLELQYRCHVTWFKWMSFCEYVAFPFKILDFITSLQWIHMSLMASEITGNLTFVQQLLHVQASTLENIQALQYWPFVMGTTSDWWIAWQETISKGGIKMDYLLQFWLV